MSANGHAARPKVGAQRCVDPRRVQVERHDGQKRWSRGSTNRAARARAAPERRWTPRSSSDADTAEIATSFTETTEHRQRVAPGPCDWAGPHGRG